MMVVFSFKKVVKSNRKCDRICFGFQAGQPKKKDSGPGAEWPYTGCKGAAVF